MPKSPSKPNSSKEYASKQGVPAKHQKHYANAVDIKKPTNTKSAHMVNYTRTKDLGVIAAHVAHPTKTNDCGCDGKHKSIMTNSPEERGKAHINLVGTRPSLNDPTLPMLAKPNGLPFLYYAEYLRYVELEENCTAANAKIWVKNTLVPNMNKIGKEYPYGVTFKVGDDYTSNPLPALSDILISEDVVTVMRHAYSNLTIKQLLDAPDILLRYFNTVDGAFAAIKAYREMHGGTELAHEDSEENEGSAGF
jgi:hypothetical protein